MTGQMSIYDILYPERINPIREVAKKSGPMWTHSRKKLIDFANTDPDIKTFAKAVKYHYCPYGFGGHYGGDGKPNTMKSWEMRSNNIQTVYYDSGVDEQGFTEDAEQYEYDSNEQYGDTEYSEDTDNGWSDGYDESVPEPEVSDPTYEEPEEAGENLTFLGTWASTGYCACELCCGQWASGYTASGTWATEGITCACGMFDFGTVLYIEGFGYRVVEDRGVEGEFVDIFYSSHDAASAHGLQYVNVYLVN